MTQSKHGGYYSVSLTKDSKIQQRLIHRLVAKAFIPNPNKLGFVDHIDNNKLNNKKIKKNYLTKLTKLFIFWKKYQKIDKIHILMFSTLYD